MSGHVMAHGTQPFVSLLLLATPCTNDCQADSAMRERMSRVRAWPRVTRSKHALDHAEENSANYDFFEDQPVSLFCYQTDLEIFT